MSHTLTQSTKSKLKKYYNENAKTIKKNLNFYNAVLLDSKTDIHFLKLFNFSNLFNGCSVLDVGCGNGFLLSQIRKNFIDCDLHGLDISDKQLSLFDGATKHNEDFENYETDKKFDFIFCIECLGYFKDQNKAIKKAISLLKPKGQLIITSFICGEIDTWEKSIHKYKIKEDFLPEFNYQQIKISEILIYSPIIYRGTKIPNHKYFNLWKRRGVDLPRYKTAKKHILFKIINNKQ